jgi:Tfp pilus assembly protein PilN
MNYEIFFGGAGAIVLGSLLTVLLTFRFQKKLLQQQLDFLGKQAAADALLRQQIHNEQIQKIKELHQMLNTKLGRTVIQG